MIEECDLRWIEFFSEYILTQDKIIQKKLDLWMLFSGYHLVMEIRIYPRECMMFDIFNSVAW